jgi:hypothetical protein
MIHLDSNDVAVGDGASLDPTFLDPIVERNDALTKYNDWKNYTYQANQRDL